jgi:16S rRNA (uracil1498-N3)-methyltransferase
MAAPSIRLFVPDPLQQDAPVELSDSQAHYLSNVMRLGAGAEVKLFNGQDGEWLARIGAISRKAAIAVPHSLTRPQIPEPDCWLCFALLKRQKTDLAVEKATELGVSVIQPVITARTQGDHVNLERLRTIAIEAAEQCERLAVPAIREPIPLPRLLKAWPAERALYLADERRTAKLLRFSPLAAALLTGPEGGFTETEVEGIAAHPFVTRVSLGARILRAETAVIAGLTLLLASDPPQE